MSWSCPERPATAIAASWPITCAATCVTDSQITGFTLPGMIEEPGWRAGRRSSPSPQRGPEASRRMSLAILKSDTAMVRSAPLASTAASRAACASKWSAASRNARPVARERSAIARSGKPAGRFRPVPTAVPPSASSASASLAASARRGAELDLPRPAADFLGDAQRRRVHQVGAPDLHHVVEGRGLAPRDNRAAARSAGSRSRWIATRAATCSAVGITSFEDCERFT